MQLCILLWGLCALCGVFLTSASFPPPIHRDHPHPLNKRALFHGSNTDWLHEFSEDQGAPNSRLNLRSQPIIACLPYTSAIHSKNNLTRYFDHVETIHTDRVSGRACFLLVHKEGYRWSPENDRKLALLVDQLGITSWNPLHPLLKIDPSAMRHVQNEEAFNANAVAHRKRRLEQLTSPLKVRNDHYYFTPKLDGSNMNLIKEHEYDIQISLLRNLRFESKQTHIDAVLEHLRHAEREPDEGWLGHFSDVGEAAGMSAIWQEGLKCINILHDKANLVTRRKKRRLKGGLSFDVSDIDLKHAVDNSPLGFILPSIHLHGGQSGETPVLSRACHVYLLAKLAQHPAVLNIALKPKPQIFNDVSKSFTQSNTATKSGLNQATAWPYTAAGLDGTDQVVIVGDTGLDRDHCHFRESVGSNISPSVYSSPKYDMSKRKIVQYIYWSYSDTVDYIAGHGTHMTSSICGKDVTNGINSYLNGMASGAKVSFWDLAKGSSLSFPVDSSLLFTPARPTGARIFSGSWGTTHNMMDQSTYILDQYLYRTDPDMLAIFAAGNSGQEGYYSVGNPGMAKNVLTVGAYESNFQFTDVYLSDTSKYRASNSGNVAYFSSMGPTYDGRIKPDILSPGMFVQAAKAAGPTISTSCSFKDEAGTSSATALTSGMALLVRQFFMSASFYQAISSVPAFTPSGALIKAVLIHAGQSMGKYSPTLWKNTAYIWPTPTEIPLNTGLNVEYQILKHEGSPLEHAVPTVGSSERPDFIQGFGRVYLQNVLPIPGQSNNPFKLYVYDRISLTSNTEYSWVVQTPASGAWLSYPGAGHNEAKLRATLVWMDPPSSIISDKSLLHDLDLIITQVTSPTIPYSEPTPSLPIWYGNGGTSEDSTNNVEHITITSLNQNGKVGLKLNAYYRITVRAHVLTEAATQMFSLVLTVPKTNTAASLVTAPDYVHVNPTPVTASGLGKIETICTNDELQIEVTMTSHLAIGWRGGDRFRINSRAGTNTPTFAYTGTMNATETMSQFILKEVLCLKAGTYDITLEEVTNTNSPLARDRYRSLGQTAVDINACYVHLQGAYGAKTDMLHVALDSNGILTCNYCNPAPDVTGMKHYPLVLQMFASIYGGRLSYGWDNKTSYAIQQGNNILYTNTLNQGVVGSHRYCLAEGETQIGFASISSDDDFSSRGTKTSAWSAGTYGVLEYSMRVLGCMDDRTPLASVDAFVDVGGSVVQNPNPYMSIFHTNPANCVPSNNDDPTPQDSSSSKISMNQILIYVAIGLGSVLVILVGYLYVFKSAAAVGNIGAQDVAVTDVDAFDTSRAAARYAPSMHEPVAAIAVSAVPQAQVELVRVPVKYHPQHQVPL